MRDEGHQSMNEQTLTMVHVDSARDWRGGQAQVEALVRGLAARGHTIVLVTPSASRLGERLADAGIEIVRDSSRGEWDLWAGRRLRRLVDRRRANLIHVHSARAHGMAWAASRKRLTPPIVVSRRVDFPVGGNYFSRRKYLHPACYYLAISSAVGDVLIRGGVARERIHLVPSGVDPAKFSYQTDGAATRRALGVGDDEFLVCNVAALTDHKDHATMIRAAQIVVRQAPDVRFIVLGEGELRRALERQIDEAELGERFRLLGFQPDVESYLAVSDLFVLSSHLEGLCTSLLDAMLLGVPIVATRAGGIPDIVVDGETGLLVEPRRPGALAAAILRAKDDPETRKRLAGAGTRRVREQFSIERTIDMTEQAYRTILGRQLRR
jgi:glycosyltransferase involved in cell wall biosynthesis